MASSAARILGSPGTCWCRGGARGRRRFRRGCCASCSSVAPTLRVATGLSRPRCWWLQGLQPWNAARPSSIAALTSRSVGITSFMQSLCILGTGWGPPFLLWLAGPPNPFRSSDLFVFPLSHPWPLDVIAFSGWIAFGLLISAPAGHGSARQDAWRLHGSQCAVPAPPWSWLCRSVLSRERST